MSRAQDIPAETKESTEVNILFC